MWSAWYCWPVSNKFGLRLQIFIKLPLSNFTEIRLVGAALTLADRRTVMTKQIGASCDYVNAPRIFITYCIQPAVSVNCENLCIVPTFFFFLRNIKGDSLNNCFFWKFTFSTWFASLNKFSNWFQGADCRLLFKNFPTFVERKIPNCVYKSLPFVHIST
jgi:hypothetical protein